MPLIVLLGFPCFVLYLSGELMSVDKIIELQKQQKKPILFGRGYSNHVYYYKLNCLLARDHVDVITFGTSRVMQFRSKFFKKDVSFYNTGGCVRRLDHLKQFLKMIPQSQEPKIIILGLDQDFFNNNSNMLKDKNKNVWIPHNTGSKDIFKTSWKKVYTDFYKGKYSFKAIFQDNDNVKRIGLMAISRDFGFRNDGSCYYGKYTYDPEFIKTWDYQFKDTFKIISEGSNHFEYGDNVSAHAVDELSNLLEECNRRGIYVIGFLPPFAHAVFIKMKSMGNKYKYLFKIEETLRPIFKKYQYSFFNFTDLASIGAPDSETLDGWHGSEKAYLRLLIKIAETDIKLKQYVDLPYIKKKLILSKSDYDVFYNEF